MAADPVFAVIEAHRAAFMRKMETGEVVSDLFRSDPEYTVAEAAQDVAGEEESEAKFALADVRPSTMTGLLALLSYVEDFNTQAFPLPKDPKNWFSDHSWLRPLPGDYLDRHSGEPIELPFIFWILRNSREALQTLAVQS